MEIFIVGWVYAHMKGLPCSLVVKNLPMQETWFDSWVGNPLEEDMATHSSILA